MAKNTSKKRIKLHTIAVSRLYTALVFGLVLALIGFLWNDEVKYTPEIISANVASGLMAAFGLIIVASSILLLVATVLTTDSSSKKAK